MTVHYNACLLDTRTTIPGQQNRYMKWTFTLLMHKKAGISLLCHESLKCDYLHTVLELIGSTCAAAILLFIQKSLALGIPSQNVASAVAPNSAVLV